MDSNSDVWQAWTIWADGEWWGDYYLRVGQGYSRTNTAIPFMNGGNAQTIVSDTIDNSNTNNNDNSSVGEVLDNWANDQEDINDNLNGTLTAEGIYKSGGVCAVLGTGNTEAVKATFLKECNRSFYNSGAGHDCDGIGNGQVVCSTSSVTAAITTALKNGSGITPSGSSGGAAADPAPANTNNTPAQTTSNSAGTCTVSDASLGTARSKFRQQCGTNYDKSKGHDCDKHGGTWFCSTAAITGTLASTASSGGTSSSNNSPQSTSSNAGGACMVMDGSLGGAHHKFRQQCGMDYNKSKGHDCDRTNGQWVCSTQSM